MGYCIRSFLHLACILFLVNQARVALGAPSDDDKVFPNRSTTPLLKSEQVQIVGEVPARPGNIDVDPENGNVYFTFHPFGKTETSCKVCLLLEKFQGYEPFADQSLFNSVLSIRVSRRKRLLLALDHKNFGESAPTMYVFNIKNAELVKAFEFPPEIAGKGSFLNDFVISKDENFAFIADPGMGASAAIITLDMTKWTAKRALIDHESTRKRKTPKDFKMNGIKYDFPFQVGVDSIALSPDGNTLYYGALLDRFMWMVPTKSLVRGGTAPEESADVAFPKPVSDGIIIDEDTGVLYLTDFQNYAIWMTDPTVAGRAKTLVVNHKLLRWPDGLSVARGYLWITASALDEVLATPPRDNPPFHILRVPLVMPEKSRFTTTATKTEL